MSRAQGCLRATTKSSGTILDGASRPKGERHDGANPIRPLTLSFHALRNRVAFFVWSKRPNLFLDG